MQVSRDAIHSSLVQHTSVRHPVKCSSNVDGQHSRSSFISGGVHPLVVESSQQVCCTVAATEAKLPF